MGEALCAQALPDYWFPSSNEQTGEIAKRICQKCPVIEECLEFAIANNEQHGIWGGTSYVERKEIRRQRGILRGTGQEIAS